MNVKRKDYEERLYKAMTCVFKGESQRATARLYSVSLLILF